ncbi:hypothetical protein PAMC26577_10725 [Caballeronia sordidicola]|uniref:Uncharacterized protein n=1 Tax=Caballeronia sordidicola TaxID=196367 RepID=A0A242MY87_CABSO|nr:hypothetical protein PAMC26577_10725 [Caballeronia sordidicola]
MVLNVDMHAVAVSQGRSKEQATSGRRLTKKPSMRRAFQFERGVNF